MRPATKAAAEVYIKRPDGTETRIVRRKKDASQQRQNISACKKDEDRESVAACPPYTASFNALLKERNEKNSRVLVNAVLERMHAEAIPLNVITYNLLMERVVGASDDIIFHLYEEIKENAMRSNSSVQPDLTTYQLLFRACERKGQYHRAFHLYMQMREFSHIVPDPSTYDTLLGFCAAVKDVAQALFFMEEMKNKGVAPNVNTYNCLMNVLKEKEPYEETLRVFHRMTECGIKPTVRTYNTISSAALKHGDYELAFQLFEEMKKKGVLPDVVTYNTLLCLVKHHLDYVLGQNAHKHLRRTAEQRKEGSKTIAELAMTLFRELESMNLTPNTFTFNELLDILILCDDFRVFDVYRTMQGRYTASIASKVATPQRPKSLVENVGHGLAACASGDQSPAGVANTCAYSAEKASHIDNADSGSSAEPNIKLSSNSLCAAGSEQPKADVAFPTLEETKMQPDPMVSPSIDEIMGMDNRRQHARISANQMQPNVDTYRLMVKACLKFGLASYCNHFYEELCRSDLALDHDFTLHLEDACRAILDPKRALEILHDAKRAGVLIDMKLFNAYLRVLADAADETLLVILEEMELGINAFNSKPDVETYNIVLRYHVVKENYDEVTRLFNSLYESYRQVRPNADTYCWVLRAYCRMKDAEAATRLIQSMQKRRIPLVIQHYHYLMQVYLEADDRRIVDVFYSLQDGEVDNMAGTMTTENNQMNEVDVANKDNESQESNEEESTREVLIADAECYRLAMEYHRRHKQWERLEAIFAKLMGQDLVEADTGCYNVVLKMFFAREMYTNARKIFTELRLKCVRVDLETYNTLLHIFATAGDHTMYDVLQDMKANRVAPEASTFGILMQHSEGRRAVLNAVTLNLFWNPADEFKGIVKLEEKQQA